MTRVLYLYCLFLADPKVKSFFLNRSTFANNIIGGFLTYSVFCHVYYLKTIYKVIVRFFEN